ncbi:pseudouridine synthase [Marinibacterium profundimaris]|uniref:pseudouridine synthase n=1 Tax=Marinibacterium profundimaris TaxID=1679460 RepID=UPI000B5279D6|nr:pseudouridine synthase [Marinibacterium profundimaris]
MSETPPPGDRIAKVLARAGVASRREAERMIETGRVAVNGKRIDSPALNVTEADRITVDGKPLAAPEPARLWLYHKPTGLVTTAKDELDRRTIFDALPEGLPRVMTVGRLDLNSEGLLLLTNDGELKRRLELPSTGWLRRYRVRMRGNPKPEDFEPLRKGLQIGEEKFQPMMVTLDRQQGSNAWVTVGLREGKNREIRRAMEDLGFAVNRLIRISYGPFQLGKLASGEVEEVRRKVLRDQLGLDGGGDDSGTAKPAASRPRGKPAPRPRGGPGAKPGGKADSAKDMSQDNRKGGKSPDRSAGGTGSSQGGKPARKPGAAPGGEGGRPAPGRRPPGRGRSDRRR